MKIVYCLLLLVCLSLLHGRRLHKRRSMRKNRQYDETKLIEAYKQLKEANDTCKSRKFQEMWALWLQMRESVTKYTSTSDKTPLFVRNHIETLKNKEEIEKALKTSKSFLDIYKEEQDTETFKEINKQLKEEIKKIQDMNLGYLFIKNSKLKDLLTVIATNPKMLDVFLSKVKIQSDKPDYFLYQYDDKTTYMIQYPPDNCRVTEKGCTNLALQELGMLISFIQGLKWDVGTNNQILQDKSFFASIDATSKKDFIFGVNVDEIENDDLLDKERFKNQMIIVDKDYLNTNVPFFFNYDDKESSIKEYLKVLEYEFPAYSKYKIYSLNIDNLKLDNVQNSLANQVQEQVEFSRNDAQVEQLHNKAVGGEGANGEVEKLINPILNDTQVQAETKQPIRENSKGLNESTPSINENHKKKLNNLSPPNTSTTSDVSDPINEEIQNGQNPNGTYTSNPSQNDQTQDDINQNPNETSTTQSQNEQTQVNTNQTSSTDSIQTITETQTDSYTIPSGSQQNQEDANRQEQIKAKLEELSEQADDLKGLLRKLIKQYKKSGNVKSAKKQQRYFDDY